jgi:hypothetical protein
MIKTVIHPILGQSFIYVNHIIHTVEFTIDYILLILSELVKLIIHYRALKCWYDVDSTECLCICQKIY